MAEPLSRSEPFAVAYGASSGELGQPSAVTVKGDGSGRRGVVASCGKHFGS